MTVQTVQIAHARPSGTFPGRPSPVPAPQPVRHGAGASSPVVGPDDAPAPHRELFTHAGVALAVLDARGVVVEVNHECGRLLGRPEEELVGSPFWDLLVDCDVAGVRSAFEALTPDADRLSTKVVVARADGAALRCHLRVSRVPHRNGRRVSALLCLTALGRSRTELLTPLRPVEREVLCQAAAGSTTTKIASATGMSRQGVDYNLRTLMDRLGATNRTELVARAYSLGVLAPGTWPPRITTAVPSRHR